jgi:hypothetical protein
MTWEFHLANALLLISYAVKEILWLRLLTCIAGLSALAALLAADPAPPRAAFVWQLTFFAINIARLAQLIYERRPVPLPPDAKRLATTVFPTLRPRQLLRLLAVGEVLEHAPGTRLVEKGEALSHLEIVIDGTARVELVDARTIELCHGAFIGELSYLTNKPPSADVVAASALRVVRWPTASLRDYLAANPDTRAVMQLVIGADLATKLRRQPAPQ